MSTKSKSVAPASGLHGGSAEPSAPLLPSQVLDRAADLIEPEGAWRKDGRWYDRDVTSIADATCFCAEGAIARIMGQHPGTVFQTDPAYYLSLHLNIPTIGVPEWNDAKRRTQAEVVKALRDAAELARSEGR